MVAVNFAGLFAPARTPKAIVDRLKQLGYVYITLDLQGFRSGSMNEVRRPRAQEITLVV